MHVSFSFFSLCSLMSAMRCCQSTANQLESRYEGCVSGEVSVCDDISHVWCLTLFEVNLKPCGDYGVENKYPFLILGGKRKGLIDSSAYVQVNSNTFLDLLLFINF